MGARARETVFWPGMTEDIHNSRQICSPCTKIAPSQPDLPATVSLPPSTPFEQIFADFFQCAGHHYLVIGDRLSGWCDVFEAPKGTARAGAEGLISNLRGVFSRFGVPIEISSDGEPEFTASATKNFLSQWGVAHRVSAAYNPKSNGRAEVSVKAAKRLLMENTGSSGSLDTDQFLRGMLQIRNTPDPDCHLSPAQIVFGKPLRDVFGFISRLEKFKNPNIRPLWREAWEQKEEALRQRFHHSAEQRNVHAHPLPPLNLGDKCYIQNQAGNFPKRWDRSGTIVETNDFDSYTVKVDGSGRITRRNRKYLRKFEPVSQRIATTRPLEFLVDSKLSQELPEPTFEPLSSIKPSTTTEMQVPTTPIRPVATDQPLQLSQPENPVHDLGPAPNLQKTKGIAKTAASDKPVRAKIRPEHYDAASGKWSR